MNCYKIKGYTEKKDVKTAGRYYLQYLATK